MTTSLINVNEEQNEIFRGISQSLKRVADIAENNDSIAISFKPSDLHCLIFVLVSFFEANFICDLCGMYCYQLKYNLSLDFKLPFVAQENV